MDCTNPAGCGCDHDKRHECPYGRDLWLIRLLTAELVPTLVAVLQRRRHDISAEDQASMLSAADDLAAAFCRDATVCGMTPNVGNEGAAEGGRLD